MTHAFRKYDHPNWEDKIQKRLEFCGALNRERLERGCGVFDGVRQQFERALQRLIDKGVVKVVSERESFAYAGCYALKDWLPLYRRERIESLERVYRGEVS